MLRLTHIENKQKRPRSVPSLEPTMVTTRSSGRSTRQWWKKYIGKRVRKKFGKTFYAGVVKQYKKPYLVVEYEDGDTEDQTEAEVKRILV